jgi:hypothetical protein
MGEASPGQYVVMRQTIDGERRLTFYRREKGDHPELPRFTKATLLGFIQFRQDGTIRASKVGGDTPVWTDRLSMVEPSSRDELMMAVGPWS